MEHMLWRMVRTYVKDRRIIKKNTLKNNKAIFLSKLLFGRVGKNPNCEVIVRGLKYHVR